MKRKTYDDLLAWKKSKNRKPLLIQGARQVGKTWLVNKFGKNEYKNYIRINFERDSTLATLFEKNLNPYKIIQSLGLYLGKKIESESTLIFFDEIQAAPRAVTSLKYFFEEAPEYNIIAAGSLLGVSVIGQESFPVGKVNFLNLFPMTFTEFLHAMGEELLYEEIINNATLEKFPEPIHEKLIDFLRQYMFIGGMPEVVQSWQSNEGINKVRMIQNDILESYQRDFSKYASAGQAIKTSELWNSVPTQLAKENKKFQYSNVRKKTRAITWESTIEWLKSAGLVHIVYNNTKPEIPLSGYCDRNKFKLYMLDVGILGAMLNLSSEIIIKQGELFSKYNGAFVENFVAQHLLSSGEKELYYWASKSDAEVDFIININDNIIPIEVKSGTSKNLKSLKSYVDKYNPKIHVRTSPRNFHNSGTFYNIPLYYNLTNLLKTILD